MIQSSLGPLVFIALAWAISEKMSALSSLFFYWNLLRAVVKGFSRILQKALKLGGAEGLGVGANIFLVMVESPLFIRPYLERMTRSEIFTLMTCGMGTMAPSRRDEIVSLGLKSIVAGTIATCMTGAVVGMIG